MSNVSRVFLIDYQCAGRHDLLRALERAGLEPHLFGSAEDFLAAYRPSWFGCLLTDVTLPGMSGLDLQQQLLLSEASLGIIFVSRTVTVRQSVCAMRAGAADFFVKPYEDDALVSRVKETLSAVARQRAVRLECDQTLESYERLRPRERQVLRLLLDSDGAMSSKDVARDLMISPRTVEHYRAAVMTKMRAESLTELLLRTSRALAERRQSAARRQRRGYEISLEHTSPG